VTELVPRHHLLNAITLNSAQFNVSRAFGPAIGGAVLATLGPGWSLLLNPVSYVAVIAGLALIRMPPAAVPRRAADRAPVGRQFIHTVRAILSDRGISACVLVVVALGLLTSPLFSLLVVFAEEVFEVSRGRYGLLAAAIGAGAVIATPFVSSRDPGRRRGPFVAAMLAVHGLAAVVFALAPGYWFAVVTLLVVGGTYLGVAANLNTTVQLLVEDARRGRVIAVYLMGLTAALPVGALVQGWLVEAVGPEPVVAGAGLLMLAVVARLWTQGWFAAMDGQPHPSPAAETDVAASHPSTSGHQRQAGPGR
jgi:predicted MFS family arabinose efflux permease